MNYVKQKITIYVDLEGALAKLAEIIGCPPHQKELAPRLGLSPNDFSNRKKRGTLAEFLLDWSAQKGIDSSKLFPELAGLLTPAGAPGDRESVPSLPHGARPPLSARQHELLDKAREVLGSEGGPGDGFVQAMKASITSSHEGVQQAKQLAGSTRAKAATANG